MKKIANFILIAVFLFGLSGCGCGSLFPPYAFSTQYTITEHCARIQDLAQEDNERLKDLHESVRYEKQDIQVEIIFALDNTPEFFIEKHQAVGYSKGTEIVLSTTLEYLFGRIIEDNYYYLNDMRTLSGEDPFALAGYSDERKYYADNKLFIQSNDGFMQFATYQGQSDGWVLLDEPNLIKESNRKHYLEQDRQGHVWGLADSKRNLIWDIQLSD